MKKYLALLTALLLTFSLAACAGNSEKAPAAKTETPTQGAEDLPVLRVASMPVVTSLPTYYIQQNHLDEKHGFQIEVTMFASGAPMNEALAADLWDVGTMGAAAVTGVANYDELIIGEVLESTDGLGVFVMPDSPIASAEGYNPSYPTVKGSPETVEGITVLCPVGTAQHMNVLKWLEKLGLEATDVNIVNMETVQAYQALQAGQCDAVALNSPTFFDAVTDGMVQVANLAEMGVTYVDMVVANRASADAMPEVIQAFMDALTEACDALQSDNDMAVDLLMQYLEENGSETSRENCVSDLERITFVTRADWKGRELGIFAKELGEFYVGVGQLDASVIDKFENNVINTFVKDYQ